MDKQSYTKVVATLPKDNLLTVQKEDGTTVTYNPARLYGVTVYRELEREFAVGDRLGFTAPSKELDFANRDLGTVQRIYADGQFSVRMDNGKTVSFRANQMRHFDHGYAVTSHSSQRLTPERVLVNVYSHVHPDLINNRFAYVAVSRASHKAQVFTDNASSLVSALSKDVTKSSATSLDQGLPMASAVEQGLTQGPSVQLHRAKIEGVDSILFAKWASAGSTAIHILACKTFAVLCFIDLGDDALVESNHFRQAFLWELPSGRHCRLVPWFDNVS